MDVPGVASPHHRPKVNLRTRGAMRKRL